MPTSFYSQATFIKSAAALTQLPDDTGFEVAFAGRSNAGKSSALNALTNIKRLAKTSKTPGRTQLINLFRLDDERRLVDLPGYGYAEVALKIKQAWQATLARYLETRQCLRGVVLLMDCRHPLKDTDITMIDWCLKRELPLHLLLTKADKLSKSTLNNTVIKLKKDFELYEGLITIGTLSVLKKHGIHELAAQLDDWFEWPN
ncbi:MAG TPA: YihA family ribosome biogenesis GTP-binding protein [Legionellales bacterium]|nr:YihA family ribosome biogenesis GTP-binding protein [Legionellales bacterium]HCA90010.1 YihA family ribosome biogenesis GTP-binding protein [Legionellales bacterium]